MAKSRGTINATLAEADRLAKVWSENVKFTLGDVTLDTLKLETQKLRNLKESLDDLRLKLSKVLDDMHDQLKVIEGYTLRGRNGMKAVFGPDSAQYAQVGGTRQSERKVGGRKKSGTEPAK